MARQARPDVLKKSRDVSDQGEVRVMAEESDPQARRAAAMRAPWRVLARRSPSSLWKCAFFSGGAAWGVGGVMGSICGEAGGSVVGGAGGGGGGGGGGGACNVRVYAVGSCGGGGGGFIVRACVIGSCCVGVG